MAFRRKLLSRRRLLALLGALALLFGLAMMHPYPRQSLFGPTIRGEPWCVWEDAVRHHVYGSQFEEPMSTRLLRWFGAGREECTFVELFDHEDMFPLAIRLVDDADWQIRWTAMSAFHRCEKLKRADAIPALRKHIHDEDFQCRVIAGRAIWRISADKQFVELLKGEVEGRTRSRNSAMNNLGEISAEMPGLFPFLIAQAKDNDSEIRNGVICAMHNFGKKGVPVLIDALEDSESQNRLRAAHVLNLLGRDAEQAVPALRRRMNDGDDGVRLFVQNALESIGKAK